MSSYMAQLDFLIKCGYHTYCPYWYNGFVTFMVTMPGWYFFSLPLSLITNVQTAFFVSLILIYLLIFVSFVIGGKYLRLSILKRIAFFLLVFANAQSIGNFIRLGRVPELFAWLNFVIIALVVLVVYKNKVIGKKFLFLIIPLSIILLSHQTIALLTLLTLLSLFLIKSSKERIYIAFLVLISAILTAFWWAPYLIEFSKTMGTKIILTQTMFLFNKSYLAQTLATFIIPLAFIIIFILYWYQNKSKQELLFFSIPFLISILLITRLIAFIPILRHIYPDVYMLYLVFFSSFMLLKMKLKPIIKLIIIIFVIASILITLFHTPWFVIPGELENEAVKSLDKIEGRFLLLGADAPLLYSRAFYSYASIYNNLSTADGWYTSIISPSYYDELKRTEEYLANGKCSKLYDSLSFFNTTFVMSQYHCNTLALCNFLEVYKGEQICIYRTL